jgi:EAL domain-containing protein (putative c-di-GMP-specific phosphodiesterase class I)/CBS domain-containing protein
VSPDLDAVGRSAGSAVGRAAFRNPADPAWDALLRRAVQGHGITPVFQPIVDVRRRVVAGYEALSRFSGAPGVGPDAWFAAAALRGIVAQLEAATLRAALARRADLPPNCFLTVNVEPESVLDPGVRAVLDAQGRLDGLALEITEHRPIDDPEHFVAALDRFRAAGALIAVDDAGAGHAGLQQILLLRPGILKLDRALVEGIDYDESKAAMVEMLGLFANRIDAWLLAEGVETLAEARRLEQLGVPLAQGYLYSRPQQPWASIDPDTLRSLRELAPSTERSGLFGLVAPAPTVPPGHPLASARDLVAASRSRVAVTLDEAGRPTGVLTADSLLAGTTFDPLRVNVHSSPAELARRLATRSPADTSTPAVVTDNAGRYLGVVTVERLLHHLSD